MSFKQCACNKPTSFVLANQSPNRCLEYERSLSCAWQFGERMCFPPSYGPYSKKSFVVAPLGPSYHVCWDQRQDEIVRTLLSVAVLLMMWSWSQTARRRCFGCWFDDECDDDGSRQRICEASQKSRPQKQVGAIVTSRHVFLRCKNQRRIWIPHYDGSPPYHLP